MLLFLEIQSAIITRISSQYPVLSPLKISTSPESPCTHRNPCSLAITKALPVFTNSVQPSASSMCYSHVKITMQGQHGAAYSTTLLPILLHPPITEQPLHRSDDDAWRH